MRGNVTEAWVVCGGQRGLNGGRLQAVVVGPGEEDGCIQNLPWSHVRTATCTHSASLFTGLLFVPAD